MIAMTKSVMLTFDKNLFTIISLYYKKFKVMNKEMITAIKWENVKICIKTENLLL